MLSTTNIKNLKFYFKQGSKILYIRLLNKVAIFVFNVLAVFNEIMILKKRNMHYYFRNSYLFQSNY